jgi:hypothetical protein
MTCDPQPVQQFPKSKDPSFAEKIKRLEKPIISSPSWAKLGFLVSPFLVIILAIPFAKPVLSVFG